MSELSGRVRGVVNTPTPAGASGRWSVRAVNKYVGSGVWPALSLGAFESIATVTVGGGGASSIEFTSIPATYQHLQVRWILQSNRGTYATDNLYIRLDGDTGTNYASHRLRGDGATAAAFNGTSQAQVYGAGVIGTTQQANNFGAGVMDILDYASASKNKTLRIFAGKDNNGTYAGVGGYVNLISGLYFATPAAVSSITVIANNGNLQEHSTAALYGIKA